MTDVAGVDCRPQGGLTRHRRALGGALAVTLVFMVVEAVGGWLANSIALMADAGHMLGDAGALALALGTAWIAQRPATAERTYGYLRFEILAALLNGAALFVLAAFIVWHAVQRFQDPPEVRAALMFGVAAVGLIANLVALKLLHAGHNHSLNMRGAYWHVLGDLLGSVGALAAAIVIALTGWTAADPAISIVIAALILVGGWRLIRESVDVLLEAAPRHIALADVERQLASIEGVTDVHDLHVWTVTSGLVAMTGHAVVPEPTRAQAVLDASRARLAHLGIQHVTLQIEQTRHCD
ncbi:MAG: cation diffusion facilitator family transporter [Gemmatimonadales bacterium]